MRPYRVLKYKESGTMLYSPCYGHVKLHDLRYKNVDKAIYTEAECGDINTFNSKGKLSNAKDAQVMLFPSINLKDWDKFNFQEGDVLQHDNGMECVEFVSYETSEENPANNYTMFKGKIITPVEHQGEIDYFTTWCFSPVESSKKSFKPFDKVLYVDRDGFYHVGLVEKQTGQNHVYFINRNIPSSPSKTYHYIDEMESLIGECKTNATERKLNKILGNE